MHNSTTVLWMVMHENGSFISFNYSKLLWFWFHEYQIIKLFKTLLTSCQNTCRVDISHLCLPCFFCPEVVFCFSQFSNSSECCVFRVPTVRPVETDCCCCCCCWHPRVWCYCWDDFGCNWNLDISGIGGCIMIEVFLTVPLFESCKHTW